MFRRATSLENNKYTHTHTYGVSDTTRALVQSSINSVLMPGARAWYDHILIAVGCHLLYAANGFHSIFTPVPRHQSVTSSPQEVHSSWEQRSLGTNHGDPSGIDVIPTGGYYPPEHNPDGDLEHTDILESKQIAAAVRNSLADSGSSGGGVGEFPPPPVPSRELRTHGMETPRRSEARRVSSDDRGAPRRETATNLWHPIPAGVTGSSDADGGVAETTGDDWDADLAEALSVVDWDVSDEISSEEDREGFRRNMLRLVRGVLGGDERHRKVRSDNATFHANIGR